MPPSQVFAKVALMITLVNRKVARSVAKYADDNLWVNIAEWRMVAWLAENYDIHNSFP